MRTLKSGKNAGCFVYYFQIGFQCDGYFNTVVETANENSVENLVKRPRKNTVKFRWLEKSELTIEKLFV